MHMAQMNLRKSLAIYTAPSIDSGDSKINLSLPIKTRVSKRKLKVSNR